MPISTTNNVGSATVVFVGVAEDKTNLINDQFATAFSGRESDYWIYPLVNYESADDFIDALEKRIDSRELVNTNLNFQFLFYEDLKGLDNSRLEELLQFNRNICAKLAIHGSTIRSIFFVLKDKQNAEEDMERFDEIMTSSLEMKSGAPKLMLVDTRPMSNLYGPIRATVRYAYAMSRSSSRLQTELSTATADSLVYVLTMSQFDIQENEELSKKKKRLEGLLDGTITREELKELLRSEFRNFVENERAKLEKKARLFGSQMPIPQKAIGGFFYWLKKKKLSSELELFKTAIIQNYEKSVFARFLLDEQDVISEFCKQIVNDERIPFAAKDIIPDSFKHITSEFSTSEVPVPGRILPCRGYAVLRKETGRVFGNMAKTDLRLEKELYERVADSLESSVNKEALQTRKQEMNDALRQIENQMNSMGNATTPIGYLLDASTITSNLRVYNGIDFSQTNEWMLISSEIALQWSSFEAYYQNPVFDCGTLDIQEFEMLRIDGYTVDLFRQNSRRFFRIVGGN